MKESFEFKVPDKCRGCGVQANLEAGILKFLKVGDAVEGIGKDLMGASDDPFTKTLKIVYQDDTLVEQALSKSRQDIGNQLDSIEETVEIIQEESSSFALACDGLMKIRASKGDVCYTVGVCTSARAYVRDSDIPSIIPTNIWVTSTD